MVVLNQRVKMKNRHRFFSLRTLLIPLLTLACAGVCQADEGPITSADFLSQVKELIPVEQRYDYHESLKTGPVHRPRRDPAARPTPEEMSIPDDGWKVVIHTDAGPALHYAAGDMREYLQISMNLRVEIETQLRKGTRFLIFFTLIDNK